MNERTCLAESHKKTSPEGEALYILNYIPCKTPRSLPSGRVLFVLLGFLPILQAYRSPRIGVGR